MPVVHDASVIAGIRGARSTVPIAKRRRAPASETLVAAIGGRNKGLHRQRGREHLDCPGVVHCEPCVPWLWVVVRACNKAAGQRARPLLMSIGTSGIRLRIDQSGVKAGRRVAIRNLNFCGARAAPGSEFRYFVSGVCGMESLPEAGTDDPRATVCKGCFPRDRKRWAAVQPVRFPPGLPPSTLYGR